MKKLIKILHIDREWTVMYLIIERDFSSGLRCR